MFGFNARVFQIIRECVIAAILFSGAGALRDVFFHLMLPNCPHAEQNASHVGAT